jgi:hypothetical protein
MLRPGILEYHRPLSAAGKNGFVPFIVSGHVFDSKPLKVGYLVLRPPASNQSVAKVFGVHRGGLQAEGVSWS